MEGANLLGKHGNRDIGIVEKRVGAFYLRGTRFQLAINNIADNRNIVGIAPATSPTAAVHYAPNGGDFLNILEGRSFTLTITGGYAPKR
jgi:hypothetical protein